nr:DUF4190 domain-containing protein [Diaminobutyricimonas sp. LJ205]
MLAAEGYDGRSVAAFVLGIAALAMSFSISLLGAVLGVAAIVVGLLSRRQLRRSTALRGSRLSLAGVILGGVAFALTAVPLLMPVAYLWADAG